MKRIYLLIFVLLVTGFVRGDTRVTRAQDALVVNSKSIALKLENSRVRVLEATLEPGVKEKLHSHPAYVIYVIAGGKVRNHGADGTVTEVTFRTGEVIYRDPITHWAENIGSTTIRLELVELKNQVVRPEGPPCNSPDRQVGVNVVTKESEANDF